MKPTTPLRPVLASALAAGLLAGTTPHLAAQERGLYLAHPSTQTAERLVTLETLDRWAEELSNWGRWGPADQRGTLNLITPEKTRRAAGLVREGVTVTLQHTPFGKSGSDTGTFGENYHRMIRLDPVTGLPPSALDRIGLSLHDGLNSHLDALCHYADREGRVYNGYPQNLNAAGCHDLAIDRMGPAYVTRGVLVDMPLLKGV